MLNRDKNGLLDILKENDIDPTEFEVEQTEFRFELTFRRAPLKFIIQTSGTSYHSFKVAYTQFAPKLPLSGWIPSSGYKDIKFVHAHFNAWLQTVLKAYLDEQSTPDLWKHIEAQAALAPSGEIDRNEFSPFTDEEKRQIRLSLSEFRLQIKETFKPNAEQLKVIDARLDYLSGALDRLNRFDWKSTLISTTISISTALSLDSDQGRQLWELAKRVVTTVMMLTQ